MDWETVEREVRSIAEAVWSSPCVSEVVAGIQCDGVIKLRADYWILIEASRSNTLEKIRTDIAKLGTLRNALFGQNIYSECYFVTPLEGFPSVRETARASNVDFHTLETFASKFLGVRQYLQERQRIAFGSAVDPDGAADSSEYTPIEYKDAAGKRYNIELIAKTLKAGKHIILLGEFGTGKSRCIKEVFTTLASVEDSFAPIAINLRENWGYKSLSHIMRNHLDEMGMGGYADDLIRSLRRGNHTILLDGFDEIGSQSWTGDPARLAETRKTSLQGVRNIAESCPKAGILITGREHYFSSDEEMLECLGLNRNCIVLRCPDEFTETEAREYIKHNSDIDVLPDWMPRKPLVCQLLAKLDRDELQLLIDNAEGEVQFFESVVDAVCKRETRIHSSLDAKTVKQVLLHLAQESRMQVMAPETITSAQINNAFFEVAGFAPIDESSVLLQRLPYLGRVGSGSSDRIFIDDYAKNGLRGLAAHESLRQSNLEVTRSNWQQPLNQFGVRVWAQRIRLDQSTLNYARQCIKNGNFQLAADYVAVKVTLDGDVCDFQGLSIPGGSVSLLSLSEKTIANLTMTNVFFDNILLDDAVLENVWIDDCIIQRFDGPGSSGNMPAGFGPKCEIVEFRDTLTTSNISELNLTRGQKTLIVIIKKLFFQPGRGRQEEALLRGTEAYWDISSAESVLRYLEQEKIVVKFRGDTGQVYAPQRRHMKRMARIVEQQKNSTDPLWSMV